MNASKNESMEAVIRQFITDSVAIGDFSNDEDLFATGFVNSLFAIEVMTFLERTFSIKVTMDDLDMENFKSVNTMCEFVKQKKEEGGA